MELNKQDNFRIKVRGEDIKEKQHLKPFHGQ